jgi:predicted  nucleic acid-binding Zn-ribbon protein
METAIAIAKLEQEMINHDQRISGIHRRLGEVQINQGDAERKVAVMAKEVEEARCDIADSKKDLTKSIEDLQRSSTKAIEDQQKVANERMLAMQISFDKKFETLTGAVRWGTGAVIAAIGVMVPLLLQLH